VIQYTIRLVWLTPSTDQPILWSTHSKDFVHTGLGLQMNFGGMTKLDFEEHSHAYALHLKSKFPPHMLVKVEQCQRQQGCFAGRDEDGIFQVGCDKNKMNSTVKSSE